ncbi:MAG: DUF4838 domain-containing protein [Armatimonadetes bacterium]|nr:DUF4838 domain-containing protein [Armatimonadota bacterium]
MHGASRWLFCGFVILSACAATSVCLPGSAACGVVLVENGQPKATIVIAAGENLKVKIASADLQTYIEKMSGAKLPIVADDQNPSGFLILVGGSRLTDEAGVRIPRGLTNTRREEGFVIISKTDRLVLAGNDEGPYHGTEYAVCDFLNRLGVRWFMPGDFGEFVPDRKNIAVPEIHVSEKPDFIMRNWWSIGGPVEGELRWRIRNKLNPDMPFDVPIDGSARRVVADAKTHPECLALNADGSRNPALPSLANPEAITVAADKIKRYFREHPESNSFAFAPDDGLPRDYDPRALEMNQGFVTTDGRPNVASEAGISEEWIRFANSVTAEVRKEFPNVYIVTNGYSNRSTPPQGVELDDHLIVMFAALWGCQIHTYDDSNCWLNMREGRMLATWCRLCKDVWVYGYRYPWPGTAFVPIPRVRTLQKDYQLLKRWGVIGSFDEVRPTWAETGVLSAYLRAQLAWNVNADAEALQWDFYSKWYGPAAKPMRAFYDALENALDKAPVHGHVDRLIREAYSPRLLEVLSRRIDEAERLAGSPTAKLHVRVDRLVLDHLKAYIAMSDAEDSADYGTAVREGNRVMEIRKALTAISPCLLNESKLPKIVGYWDISDRVKYYQSVLDRTSGKEGDLVAVLPARPLFRTDPYDCGIWQEWYSPTTSAAGWIPITTTRPFYVQGYPYLGYLWYKFEVNIPALENGRRVELLAPVVEPEAWCWVNGKYVGHRPYREAHCRPSEMAFDISEHIRSGEANDISVRIFTGYCAAQAAGGVHGRVVLYSPK